MAIYYTAPNFQLFLPHTNEIETSIGNVKFRGKISNTLRIYIKTIKC